MKSRHRRPSVVPARADRLWRWPLAVAVVIFAVSGPLHAMGWTDLVYYASLGGLTLGGLAVPVGLLGLRRRR
ncbi:hypothetical protein [Actinoplanes sp. NBRC 103695]|uniref:hypothetical protein n=1 Tax=Actinoplanes sp. NBRC 103695 TaxID=3032202 RepID=UPI0024A49CA5|nr:hypothetical protein [Actinoplanes sp. NBRC 103695]GLY98704.1 hypothetical protein Acsp02_59580 [Actinoplanes sp. NBRC 103695]